MNYLKYIEHDAENLQFFLWARAYVKKFADLPESERKLSPEWTQEFQDMDAPINPQRLMVGSDTAAALKGTGLEAAPKVTELVDEENNNSSSSSLPVVAHAPPSEVDSTNNISSEWYSISQSNGNASEHFRRKAEGAFDDAGLKWQPCKFTFPEIFKQSVLTA